MINIEQARTLVEKAQVQLAPGTIKEHELYLAGFCDALFDCGQISDEDRGKLYLEYGPVEFSLS